MNDDPADQPTPPLREDLQITDAAAGGDGEPAWVISDSVVNRYYRIGWFEFECLLRWGQAPRLIAAQIGEQTALAPDAGQVLAFGQFLQRHRLLRPAAGAAPPPEEGARWFAWRWWLHHYLFFRVPLLRPQAWLDALARRLAWLLRPWAGWTVLLLGVLGVVLALRQWDSLRAAVVDSFSAQGLLSFAAALAVAKTLHELGHALVATRLGLRVAHMGVAFVVLWPMLYTDTGETWKLRNPRHRLAIASAGILTELGLAGLATLGWCLADPGPWRNALLYLATTSWVLSLALNASPFMRFDGYFILSDLLDFPNLHERAGALARAALRRGLLGLPEEWPESFAPARRRLLIAFAIATWLYRLAVFLGIAVAVYLLFFKALGIVLFAVEIAWFIVLPVWRELRLWWQRRAAVPTRRRVWLALALLAPVLVLALPWRTQVAAVGMARAEQQLRVYAPAPARLQQLRAPGPVRSGETLVALDDPDAALRIRGAEAGARGYEERLAGLLDDPGGSAEQAATWQRLVAQIEEARAARSDTARLRLVAPFDGEWRDVDPLLAPGQWTARTQQLGVLVAPGRWQVDAYVAQDQVDQLAPGRAVRFYAEGVPDYIAGQVVVIGSTRVAQLAHPALAARYGGPITTAPHSEQLVPVEGLFRVLVQLDAPPPGREETRGRLQIDGAPHSPLAAGLRQVWAVLLRESGF